MALFDASMFNPSSYNGGMSGGILGYLAQALRQSAGLSPEDTGFTPTVGGAGNLPVPTIGQPTTTDLSAQSRQPIQQPQAAPFQVPTALQSPAGGNIGAGVLGLLNAQSPLQGLGNLFQGLVTGQRTDPAGMMQQSAQATYQALKSAGVPDGVAQAAALNSEVLKTIAPQLYNKPKAMLVPGIGGSTVQFVDEANQTINGQPVNAPGGNGALNPLDALAGKIEQLRQGGATQQRLLQEVPASLREGVSAMVQGKNIPANLSFRGDARNQAVLIAHAIDPSFDETMIPRRQEFAREMAKSTPNSQGGQKLLLNTAIQHAGEMADAIPQLENTSGPIPGIYGGSYVANAINATKNTTVEKAGIVNKMKDIGQKLSGEIGRLYSGVQGGGEVERLATAKRFSESNTPEEFAGALEATRNLILDKLNALQNARDQVYGTAGEGIYPLVDKQTQVALNKIDAAIAKLRSGGSVNPAKAGAIIKYDAQGNRIQ